MKATKSILLVVLLVVMAMAPSFAIADDIYYENPIFVYLNGVKVESWLINDLSYIPVSSLENRGFTLRKNKDGQVVEMINIGKVDKFYEGLKVFSIPYYEINNGFIKGILPSSERIAPMGGNSFTIYGESDGKITLNFNHALPSNYDQSSNVFIYYKGFNVSHLFDPQYANDRHSLVFDMQEGVLGEYEAEDRDLLEVYIYDDKHEQIMSYKVHMPLEPKKATSYKFIKSGKARLGSPINMMNSHGINPVETYLLEDGTQVVLADHIGETKWNGEKKQLYVDSYSSEENILSTSPNEIYHLAKPLLKNSVGSILKDDSYAMMSFMQNDSLIEMHKAAIDELPLSFTRDMQIKIYHDDHDITNYFKPTGNNETMKISPNEYSSLGQMLPQMIDLNKSYFDENGQEVYSLSGMNLDVYISDKSFTQSSEIYRLSIAFYESDESMDMPSTGIITEVSSVDIKEKKANSVKSFKAIEWNDVKHNQSITVNANLLKQLKDDRIEKRGAAPWYSEASYLAKYYERPLVSMVKDFKQADNKLILTFDKAMDKYSFNDKTVKIFKHHMDMTYMFNSKYNELTKTLEIYSLSDQNNHLSDGMYDIYLLTEIKTDDGNLLGNREHFIFNYVK